MSYSGDFFRTCSPSLAPCTRQVSAQQEQGGVRPWRRCGCPLHPPGADSLAVLDSRLRFSDSSLHARLHLTSLSAGHISSLRLACRQTNRETHASRLADSPSTHSTRPHRSLSRTA
eukprot:scaffold161880_cov28-Tisochrysis_lutea.AAC.5